MDEVSIPVHRRKLNRIDWNVISQPVRAYFNSLVKKSEPGAEEILDRVIVIHRGRRSNN